MGVAALYFDGSAGRYLGESQPWKGTVGDHYLVAETNGLSKTRAASREAA